MFLMTLMLVSVSCFPSPLAPVKIPLLPPTAKVDAAGGQLFLAVVLLGAIKSQIRVAGQYPVVSLPVGT